MSDPHVFADVEELVLDYLKAELPNYVAGFDPEADIGIGVPVGWTIDSGDYLQLQTDGTPTILRSWGAPVVAHATIRLVAWSRSTTSSKRFAAVALAVLGGLGNVRELTGPLPSRDTKTSGEITATTARITIRATRLESLGS